MVNGKRTATFAKNIIMKKLVLKLLLLLPLIPMVAFNTVITDTGFYDLTIKSLDETKDINFKDYKGKKVLIVNVASECGFTPQYEGLQALHEKYGKKLVVIGVPCNQFGKQEPGNAEQIQSFCKKNYGVTFQLTEKVDVKGIDRHPLYAWLTTKSLNGVDDYEVKWNFNKFLIDESGNLIGYFKHSVKPDDTELIAAIEK